MGRDRSTDSLAGLIRTLDTHDERTRELLVDRLMLRIHDLAQRQLRGFPAVARWEQTDDIVQGVAIRLHRALKSVRPADEAALLAFCSELIRRELIDLKRKHFGPMGIGANHASPPPGSKPGRPPGEQGAGDASGDPSRLARWTELHETAAGLPEDLRRVFDLVWYLDLTHAEAAEALGVSSKTVARRWREARLRLHHLVADGDV